MGRGRQRERSLVPENAGLMLMAGPREEARAGTRRGTGAREGGGANTGVDEGEGGGGGGWCGSVGRDDRDGEGEYGWGKSGKRSP